MESVQKWLDYKALAIDQKHLPIFAEVTES